MGSFSIWHWLIVLVIVLVLFGRGRVADIMNRARPLSIGMIRRLSSGLGLPADVLIQPYPLREPAAASARFL